MKKILVPAVITLILFSFSACCTDDSNDDNLTFNKTSYTGTELKTNGFFYEIGKFGDFSSATFFYDNGIMNDIEGSSSSLNAFEVYINEVSDNNWSINNKTGWGIFKIESNVLYYQRWYPKPYCGLFKVFTHECEIVNDSTYILKKQYRIANGQLTELTFPNVTYKLVKFQNKPSPINPYIQ